VSVSRFVEQTHEEPPDLASCLHVLQSPELVPPTALGIHRVRLGRSWIPPRRRGEHLGKDLARNFPRSPRASDFWACDVQSDPRGAQRVCRGAMPVVVVD
jgi:hypothetical protein